MLNALINDNIHLLYIWMFIIINKWTQQYFLRCRGLKNTNYMHNCTTLCQDHKHRYTLYCLIYTNILTIIFNCENIPVEILLQK